MYDCILNYFAFIAFIFREIRACNFIRELWEKKFYFKQIYGLRANKAMSFYHQRT